MVPVSFSTIEMQFMLGLDFIKEIKYKVYTGYVHFMLVLQYGEIIETNWFKDIADVCIVLVLW